MPINTDPVTALQNSTFAPAKSSGQDLGSVDFMKLIVAQMRNQNPLEPAKDTDFMAQMAQFESFNQAKATARSVAVLQGLQELTTAAGLLGHNVVGAQVNGTGITRDTVARELYGAPFAKLTSELRAAVNNDDRVRAAVADAENAGKEVSGTVERVSVGPDGVPLLWINGKAVDPFTIAEVR